jgi:hypothetical protein
VALSLSIVEASRPEALGEAADQLRAKLTDIDTIIGGQRDAMGRLDEAWRGPAADAAADRAMRDLGRQQAVRSRLARVHSALGAGGARLSSIRTALLSIVDPLRASGWQVHGDGTAIAPPYPEIFQSLESAFTAIIKRLLDLFGKTDTATATAIDVAMTEPENLPGEDAVSYGIGPGDVPLSPKAGTDEQRQNQIDAFREATGRDPRTPNDWRTAAMLDEANYSDKNGNVASNVVVGQIEPVAGQGSVQTNLFIPGEEAWYPDPLGGISGHNLGDNRGFDPNAGPEASRVALYVDYENGLVVARQNPSIDTRTGDIKVGTPQVNVSQNPQRFDTHRLQGRRPVLARRWGPRAFVTVQRQRTVGDQADRGRAHRRRVCVVLSGDRDLPPRCRRNVGDREDHAAEHLSGRPTLGSATVAEHRRIADGRISGHCAPATSSGPRPRCRARQRSTCATDSRAFRDPLPCCRATPDW